MKNSTVSPKLSADLIDSVFCPDEIDSWVENVARQIKGVCWKHVGWTEEDPYINNAGVCEVANDKRAPIAEVLFNGVDSVIDLAQRITGFKVKSPHEAVAKCELFHPDKGGWCDDKVSISLRDSRVEERPTVDIRDFGRGQHPDDFRHTFLSLHSSTKLDLPHLCGKFGMGMKSAFKFCDRLVVVSRPHESVLASRSEQVGVSVIRKQRRDTDKVAHYEYLCDANGQIIRLDIPRDSFPFGTLVRMSNYDLDGFHGGFDKPNKSLYLLLNSYLIAPPINIRTMERRGKQNKSRRFRGLVHALTNPKVANSHEDSFGINLDFDGAKSHVGVRYFVLHPKSSPHDKSGTKVKAEQGITFSHNGQRHGVESRITFKSRFGLGAIYQRLYAVIDTSGLHPSACSDLYSSNRIAVNPSSKVYTTIMDALQAHFDGDDELQALDDEATRFKREEQAGETESIEKAVASFAVDILGKKRIAFGKGDVGVAKNKGGKPSRRNKDDSHLPNLPTRVLVDNNPFVAPQGRFAYLDLDIDAKNGYIQPNDGKVSVNFGGNVAHVRTQGRLVGGKLRLAVDVPASSPKGESKFDVRLRDPANSIDLSTSGVIKIVEPRNGRSGGGNKKVGGSDGTPVGPDVSVNWVFKHEWEETNNENWNASYPGECTIKSTKGVVTIIKILLNGDFAPIEAVRLKLKKNKGSSFNARKEKYGVIIGKALLQQQLQSISPETSFAAAIAESIFEGCASEIDEVDEGDDVKEKVSVPTPRRGSSASKAVSASASSLVT
jgi:hypothetical protein